MNLDKIIQKYLLCEELTKAEDEFMKDQLLRFYNEVRTRVREFKAVNEQMVNKNE